MKDRADSDAAAQEAYEEAGLEGVVSPTTLGHYQYVKTLKKGDQRLITVAVYSLCVTKELLEWPELGQRERRWMTPTEAALAVGEAQLRDIIGRFSHAEKSSDGDEAG